MITVGELLQKLKGVDEDAFIMSVDLDGTIVFSSETEWKHIQSECTKLRRDNNEC